MLCFKIIGKLLDALKVNISSTKIPPNVAFVFQPLDLALRGVAEEFPGEWVLGWGACGGCNPGRGIWGGAGLDRGRGFNSCS